MIADSVAKVLNHKLLISTLSAVSDIPVFRIIEEITLCIVDRFFVGEWCRRQHDNAGSAGALRLINLSKNFSPCVPQDLINSLFSLAELFIFKA